MARFSDVVCFTTPLILAIGLVACTGGGNDFPIAQPGGDGGVDSSASGDAAGDAILDARPDARPDAQVPSADLSVAITASSDPVAASSTLTYTIDVTDHGGLDATNITVTQRLPSGDVQFQSATGIGWTCVATGQLVTCTRSTLLVGAAPSIAVTVTTPPVGGSIDTSVVVASDVFDPDTANNTTSATTTVLTPADLGISVSDSPDPVAAGGTLTYSITVTNNGPGASSDVTVVDQLQAGVVFGSASGTDWSCSPVGQIVTCFLQTLAASASSTITLVVSAPTSGGAVSNTAQVSASTPDNNQGNNTATASTSVNAAADLSIALSASPSPVPAASTLTYTITVANLGPRDASNVAVTSRLPDGNVLLLNATGIDWSCSVAGQIVTCTRASLLVGAAPLITVQLKTPAASGPLTYTANVSASTTDLDLSNNTATITTGVFDSADLSVIATATPNPVRIGTEIAYTLSVANDGPTAATALSVSDTLPDGVTFASANGLGWTCGNVDQHVTCTMPTLASESSAPSITITATAPSSPANITNTATITSSTSDPDSSNNTVSTTTLANLFADLSVTIVDNIDPVQGTTNQGCGSNDCVTYAIVVANAGPDTATGLTVTTQLPPNGSFFNAVGAGWVCPAPGTVLTCTRVASLAPSATAPTIALTWKAPSPGGFSIVVTPTVSASSTDPDLSNNTATQDTTVRP